MSSALVFTAGLVVGAGTVALTSRRPPPREEREESKAVSKLGRRELDGSLRFGNPGPVSDLFFRQAYASGYDRRLRHPAWTAEHLTSESIKRPPALPGPPGSPDPGRPDRSNSTFREDEEVPSMFRARLSDYFRSGFDRGHMVPAADAKKSQTAMDETFLLTNVAPQVGEGFNREYWAYFEEFTRRLTGSFRDVYVFTIPLYLPQFDVATRKYRISYEVIGNPPNVAVPTHFAKVIYGSGGQADVGVRGALGAFVLPNAVIPDSKPLEEFVVPVEAVERAAGLSLFPEAIKSSAPALCRSVECSVVVRRFDDTRKRLGAPTPQTSRPGPPTRSQTI